MSGFAAVHVFAYGARQETSMSEPEDAESRPPLYDLLRRIRDARRALHYALTRDADARGRMFDPANLLQTLRKHVDQIAIGSDRERCGRLFVLTVVLYASLDWHFAGQGVDTEDDVRSERVRQNYRFGGPEIDDRLSAKDWQARMRGQLLRLEQQLAVEELYGARLIKLAAVVQSALEAVARKLP
jgi:hypothetical protein